MRPWAIGALACALAACGGPPPLRATPSEAPSAADLEARGVELDTRVDEALRALCFLDPTFRSDNGVPLSEPCPGAHELERTASAELEERNVGGIVDPMAFDLRERLLDGAARAIEEAERPPFAVTRSDGSRRDLDAVVARSRVMAERAHVAMERDFARSASRWLEIVRSAWPVDDDSRAVTRARALILAKVATHAKQLTVTEARAADDALDALEAAGLVRGDAARAVTTLHAVLDAVEPAAPHAPLERFGEWLEATTGEAADAERDRRALVRVVALTYDVAERALADLPGAARAEAGEAAARLVVSPRPCRAGAPKSQARSLSPPRERRAMCVLSRAFREPGSTSRVVALMATHDAAVLALRAWETITPPAAPAHHAAIALVGPVWEARGARFVATEPVAAIGGGFAAEILTALGVDGAEAIARAYALDGDAPFPIGAPRWVSRRE